MARPKQSVRAPLVWTLMHRAQAAPSSDLISKSSSSDGHGVRHDDSIKYSDPSELQLPEGWVEEGRGVEHIEDDKAHIGVFVLNKTTSSSPQVSTKECVKQEELGGAAAEHFHSNPRDQYERREVGAVGFWCTAPPLTSTVRRSVTAPDLCVAALPTTHAIKCVVPPCDLSPPVQTPVVPALEIPVSSRIHEDPQDVGVSESTEDALNRLIRSMPVEQRQRWFSMHNVKEKCVKISSRTGLSEKERKERVDREGGEKEAVCAAELETSIDADLSAQTQQLEKSKRARAAELDAQIQKCCEEKQRLVAGDTVAVFGNSSPGSPFQGVWEPPKDPPPCETNDDATPIGKFWDHLKQYAFAKAARTFPWHLEWNKQCPAKKVRFKSRLREYYPGSWDEAFVMRQVGNNLKERRARVRQKFEVTNHKDSLTIPVGCSQQSWNAIFDSLGDPKKQRKALKCRVAAQGRFKNGGRSHKWGRMGMKSTICRFVDEFERSPTEEEIEYAKLHAYAGLAERTRANNSMETMVAGDSMISSRRPHKRRRWKSGDCTCSNSQQVDHDKQTSFSSQSCPS